MRLYAGTSKNFIEDTVRNQIAEKLRRAISGMGKVIMNDLLQLFSFELTGNNLFVNIKNKEN